MALLLRRRHKYLLPKVITYTSAICACERFLHPSSLPLPGIPPSLWAAAYPCILLLSFPCQNTPDAPAGGRFNLPAPPPFASPGQFTQANLSLLCFGSTYLWHHPLPSPRTPGPRAHRVEHMPIFPRMNPHAWIMRLPHVMQLRNPWRTRTHPVP